MQITKINPFFEFQETFPAKRVFGNTDSETLLFRKQRFSSIFKTLSEILKFYKGFIEDVLKFQKDQDLAFLIADFFEIYSTFSILP